MGRFQHKPEAQTSESASKQEYLATITGGWAMGYLISVHLTRERGNFDRLSELPKSIGHRLYHHQSADVYMIDTFRCPHPPEYPFQSTLPVADISLHLPTDLSDLQSVYGYLNKHKLGNSFKTSYVNFSLLLHGLLDVPVLSLVSDDDDLDFACTAADGKLLRLKCRCEDLLVIYQDGTTYIQPLVSEFEEDDDELTNVEALREVLPGIQIADRDTVWDPQLHAVAIEEWGKFSGSDQTILGLGSFDPPEDESEWELIGAS